MLNLEERTTLLRNMNYQVKLIEDENAYMEWINYIPDEPDEEDFLEIAEDFEDFHSACVLFCKIITKYCF